MASPYKKMKLTPKKSTTRTTQESKVTSTPQGSIRSISSPNISDISSHKSIRSRISYIFEEVEDVDNIQRSPSVQQSTTSSIESNTFNFETGGGIHFS